MHVNSHVIELSLPLLPFTGSRTEEVFLRISVSWLRDAAAAALASADGGGGVEGTGLPVPAAVVLITCNWWSSG